jgi:hypothetical protein
MSAGENVTAGLLVSDGTGRTVTNHTFNQVVSECRYVSLRAFPLLLFFFLFLILLVPLEDASFKRLALIRQVDR